MSTTRVTTPNDDPLGANPAKYSCAKISSGDARRRGSKVSIRSSRSVATSPTLPAVKRDRMFPGRPRIPRRYRRQRSDDTASTSVHDGVPMTSKKRLRRARIRLSAKVLRSASSPSMASSLSSLDDVDILRPLISSPTPFVCDVSDTGFRFLLAR